MADRHKLGDLQLAIMRVLWDQGEATVAEVHQVAIGGVGWLTTARVIRGQVLSLRAQPFMEACPIEGTTGGSASSSIRGDGLTS